MSFPSDFSNIPNGYSYSINTDVPFPIDPTEGYSSTGTDIDLFPENDQGSSSVGAMGNEIEEISNVTISYPEGFKWGYDPVRQRWGYLAPTSTMQNDLNSEGSSKGSHNNITG